MIKDHVEPPFWILLLLGMWTALLLAGCGNVAAQQGGAGTVTSVTQMPMVVPKVQHHDEQQTTHYDVVTRTCPKGYEGHFVDMETGFDGGWGSVITLDGAGPEMFTVCFSNEFMESLRKNPEMRARKPQIRGL